MRKTLLKFNTTLVLLLCVLLLSCTTTNNTVSNVDDSLPKGFGILTEICGIWSGPVKTTTPAGSFPNWYADFRPVSESQVSQFSLLDEHTVNDFSFFIVDYNGEQKVAMRTFGCFNNQCCVTYEVIDSVNDEEGYYRFADFVGGKDRAYTEFIFTENTMIMEVYTSKFNQEDKPVLHTRWETKLCDKEAAKNSIEALGFPKPTSVRDFSDAFKNMKESIFFTFESDPYSSEDQPYVGSVEVAIEISQDIEVAEDDEIFILLATESFFDGLKFIRENVKYSSKSVFLKSGTTTFVIKNVHPGEYYVYSYLDINQDKTHKSGDYMSSKTDNKIVVQSESLVKVNTLIDMIIP